MCSSDLAGVVGVGKVAGHGRVGELKVGAGSHGFGTQSIKLATEKYGGYCSIKTEFSTYSLNILIPTAELPQED